MRSAPCQRETGSIPAVVSCHSWPTSSDLRTRSPFLCCMHQVLPRARCRAAASQLASPPFIAISTQPNTTPQTRSPGIPSTLPVSAGSTKSTSRQPNAVKFRPSAVDPSLHFRLTISVQSAVNQPPPLILWSVPAADLRPWSSTSDISRLPTLPSTFAPTRTAQAQNHAPVH